LKGFDNFDVDACSRRGVLVTILPDLLTDPGAELAIGLMIAAGRNLLAGDRYVRSGEFSGWRPHFYGTGLAGSTVGILGYGAVGRALSERLTGFKAEICYWDKFQLEGNLERTLGVKYKEFDELLRISDFLVLALPLTPETLHIINEDSLQLMKADAILINFARGSLVDESAVSRALKMEKLGFYAADVFECEDWALTNRPHTVNPDLVGMPDKTLLSPHLGSAVARVRAEMAMQAAENAIMYFAGQVPQGAVNAEALRSS
jgi:phosphonate dehydrogenase